MRFAVTGDVHFHNYAQNARTLQDGTNSRLQDIINAWRWMTNTAIEKDCDWFFCAGDLWHNRKSLPVDMLHRVYSALSYSGERINQGGLVGNHDMSVNGDGTHSLLHLDGIMTVQDKPEVCAYDGGDEIAWLPYTDDPEAVRHFVKKNASKKRTLIAHLGIGDPRHSDCVPTDYELPGCINVSDLSPEKWMFVFLGHYHAMQELAPNCFYVGSPLQLSYKEAGQVKGFFIADTTTKKAEFIENTKSPQFHTITSVEKKQLKKIPLTDFVRVKVASKEEKDAFIEEVDDREGIRFDVLPNTDTKARLEKADATDKELLSEFASLANVPSDELDAVVDVGLDLLRKVEENG